MIEILRKWFAIISFLVAVGASSSTVYASSCAVNVKSIPSEAEVYVDSEYVGNTTVFYTIGYPTVAEVIVRKEGYKEWKRLVNVPLDETVEVYAELEPVKTQETPPPVKTPPPEEAKAKPEEKEVCGPTALLALAMLPLGIRRLFTLKNSMSR